MEWHRIAKTSGKFAKPALWLTATLLVMAVVGWIAFKPTKTVEPIALPKVETPAQKPVITPEKTEASSTTIVPESKATTSDKPKEIKTETKPGPVAADVYTEAEPLSGYPDLYAYFQKELKYPVEALKDSIEGIVSVSFVINRNGKPEQIKILHSLGAAFDSEAIRVISAMPEWKPASLNGKPMPARISMPLTFQVEQNQKQP
jgi:TonB family protein